MNKKKVLNIILFILVFIIIVCVILYIFPILKGMLTEEGRAYFKTKLDSFGAGKFWVMCALQLLQILLVVVPGEPLEIMAGMCFGTIGGTIFILGTVFVSTTLIFVLVRRFGKSYVEHFFKKEKLEKIENSKFFSESKNIELVMTILFLIPGTPKDLLVYLGGLLPIKARRFILISTFARFPSVISSTLVGSNILKGNFWYSALIYLLTFAIAAGIILLVNKFDKSKITKEAIDVIK